MSEQLRPPGKTTVAPDVMVAIVRLAALGAPGVSRLAMVPGGVNRIFTKGANEGVQIHISEDTVEASVYVNLEPEVNVIEVAHDVQARVARAICEMVGMEVGRVDVSVEDIDFEQIADKSS